MGCRNFSSKCRLGPYPCISHPGKGPGPCKRIFTSRPAFFATVVHLVTCHNHTEFMAKLWDSPLDLTLHLLYYLSANVLYVPLHRWACIDLHSFQLLPARPSQGLKSLRLNHCDQVISKSLTESCLRILL